jgi:hypothetical protein
VIGGSELYSSHSKLALFAKPRMSGRLGVTLKRMIAKPRFNQQLAEARRGFKEHGQKYKHHVLYVAGLPKSGTTWLDRMLTSLEGYAEVTLPEFVYHELIHHETLTFELPKDSIDRLRNSLSVLRTHSIATQNNVEILEANKVPYVVLYRDLRDVAVSHHHFVSTTPWHPEYPKYAGKTVQEGVAIFARDLLDKNVEWIQSWRRQEASPLCKIITYEQMRQDPHAAVRGLLDHYEIPNADTLAPALVEATTLEKLSQGGKDSFFRKGSVGDWIQHFPKELVPVYEAAVKAATS